MSATFTGLGAIILTIKEAAAMPTPERPPEEVLDELLPKIEDTPPEFDEDDDEEEYEDDDWDEDDEEEDEASPDATDANNTSEPKN